jgi:hypothetical protein
MMGSLNNLKGKGMNSIFGKILLASVGLWVLVTSGTAQNTFSPGGPDYPIIGNLSGDQVWPDVAISESGGWLVWQDNGADGDGWGVRAARLNSALTVVGNVFTVNQMTNHHQEKPRVALLHDGGAVVVWQGGKKGSQNIYARLINSNGTFLTGDIQVNTYTNEFREDPAVAVLSDGSILVVWVSFNQDGSMRGIFGQRLNSSGKKLGSEFQINQFTENNQRSPTVCSFPDGRVFVAWVSELQRYSRNAVVDIWGRFYKLGNSGILEPITNEFLVSGNGIALCANPIAIPSPEGKVLVVWSQNNSRTLTGDYYVYGQEVPSRLTQRSPSDWDVVGRLFDADGNPITEPFRVNTYTMYRQYAPRGSVFGQNFLVVWTSEAQDGSREGIFGQFIGLDGTLRGNEFQINTTTASRQICPVVGSDGKSRFLVVWTQFGVDYGFDLRGRVYDLIRLEMTPVIGGVKLTWNTVPRAQYQVQQSSNGKDWINVGPVRVATNYSDSLFLQPTNTMAIYRVIRVE